MSQLIPDEFSEEGFEDRQRENRKYSDPNLDPDIIRRVRVKISRGRDFRVEFENEEFQYTFVVILKDRNQIGWRECQAIYDSVFQARRGNKVTNETFLNRCMHLDFRYGNVRGPIIRNERLVTWIHPSPGEITYQHDNMTSHVSLRFDEDGNLVIRAFTFEENMYEFIIYLETANQYLSEMDCDVFMDLLKDLEPGDTLDDDTFKTIAARIRVKYNFVLVETLNDHGKMACHIFPSRVKNTNPIDPILSDYVPDPDEDPYNSGSFAPDGTLTQSGVMTTVDTQTFDLMESPYPGIRYLGRISESSQGEVFSGIMEDGTSVAVKVFTGNSKDSLESYRRELRMLRRMKPHPNVIEVLSFYENPQPALITRLIVGGGNLLEYLQNEGRLSEDQGTLVALDIAKGIEHMHHSGVIHGDLKSPNIMMEEKEESETLVPVIIDFGLSSKESNTKDTDVNTATFEELARTYVEENSEAQQTGVRGTIPWMAPELISSQVASQKSDVYAFGVILWEIFSGREPFDNIRNEIHHPVQLLTRIYSGERPDPAGVEHLPDNLQRLIYKMLEMDEENRPTMMEVVDILNGNDIKEVFDTIDKDNSGHLKYSEFIDFLEKVAPELSPGQMTRIFEAIDENKDNQVSFLEFRKFWSEVQRVGIEEAIDLYQRGLDSYHAE